MVQHENNQNDQFFDEAMKLQDELLSFANSIAPDKETAWKRLKDNAWLNLSFSYVFFSGDDLELKKRILVIHEQAFVEPWSKIILHAIEHYKTIPSFEFMKESLNFTISCESFLCKTFAETELLLQNKIVMDRKREASNQIQELNSNVQGLTFPEISKNLDEINNALPVDKIKKEFTTVKDFYNEMKNRPKGILTFLEAADDVISGVSAGNLITIAGYTGSFKTTMGLNILYKNTTILRLNGVFLSLEMDKEVLSQILLIKHANSSNIVAPSCPIPIYKDIRTGKLTEEQEDFLFNEVEPKFNNSDYGKIAILEQSDLNTGSVKEIERILNNLPFTVDFLVIDYCQLLKYLPAVSDSKEGVVHMTNKMIRELCDLSKSYNKGEGLSLVLLSQINRESFKAASEKDTKFHSTYATYDLTCLSEFNELERSSSVVITLYSDDSLKSGKEMRYQVLKNRFGETICTPKAITINPEIYFIGDETTSGGASLSSLASSKNVGAGELDSFFGN